MIFAKQILCAMVADSEEEIDNMWLIRREMPYAECVHHIPTLECFVSRSYVEQLETKVTTVPLQQVGFLREIVGRVGKCPECGKIFYWIPEIPEIILRREVKKYADSNRRGL